MCEKLKQKTLSAGNYLRAFVKWLILATITGGLGGAAISLFRLCINYVTDFRDEHNLIILFLPLAGVVIVFIYRLAGMDKTGTNSVIRAARSEEKVPLALAPLIFIATALTHLFGGSVGRTGAALQIGGSIGELVKKIPRLDETESGIIIMCCMSAVFSALFGTPLAATFFALEVIMVGVIRYSAFIPCLLSSVLAYKITLLFGLEPGLYPLAGAPELSLVVFFKTIAVAVICAAVSIVFCVGIYGAEKGMKKLFKNPYIRVFVGGAVIAALTFLLGTTDYNGVGTRVIAAAVQSGIAAPWAFALKLLFTVITIGAGFKGGEILPALFIGATLGCVLGGVFRVDPGFAAALGMISMFCGVVNCPVASIFFGVEMFGASGIVLFATAAAVSYVMSGYYGLYSSQIIEYSKLDSEQIDVHTKRN